MRVCVLAPGPAGHGVVRHARAVSAAAARHGAVPVHDGPADLTHAQFTDALWGSDIGSAAEAFERAARTAARPLVVTLHDVPGADPDPARDRRRRDGYRRVVAASDVVVVSARHEADKARALGAAPVVVPLPLPDVVAPGPRPPWTGRPTLGVLGFVYPGKGHDDVIAAAAAHPDRPGVVAAGAVADGHDDLAADLAAAAAAAGVGWTVTGSLSPAGLAAAAAAVDVPVVPGWAVSASGSLLAWLAHGRRPLVADGAYAREVAAAAGLHLYRDDGERDRLVASALGGRSRTVAAAPVWPDPGPAHVDVYRRALS